MNLSDYDILFDLPSGEYNGQGIDGVRTTTWRAGRSLEVVCYPITRITREAKREAKRRRTTDSMAKINARNTERHMMRMIEANFTPEAAVVTGTYAYPFEDYGMCDLAELSGIYAERKLPWEMERVRMDVRNWLSKLRRRVVKVAGNAKDFKWIVQIHEGKEQPAPGVPARFHFHAIVEGPGLDKDTVQAAWEEKHGRCHCDRLYLKDNGAAQLARYFNKQRLGGRWWSHSRNLKIVQPTISDRSVSRRRLKLLAMEVKGNAQKIFSEVIKRAYKGKFDCKVVETQVSFSDYVNGAYIYARMYLSENITIKGGRGSCEPIRRA